MGDLYTRALLFAADAHAGQTRDLPGGGTEPYVEHCRRVAEMVALLTDDEATVIAAMLHDAFEQTSVSAADIRNLIGDREMARNIIEMVIALTDIYTSVHYPRRNRAWRKAKEAERLGQRDWQVRLIKLCDVIDNARSIEVKGDDFASVWRAEKMALVPLLMMGWAFEEEPF